MKSLVLVAVVAIAAASFPGSDGSRTSHPPDPHRATGVHPIGPEPGPTVVTRGDKAPNFSFEAPDGQWRRLRDLLAAGGVVLVFGASDAELRAIEVERNALLNLGVVPVAVVSRRSGSAWAAARELKLHYPVVPDPQRVIAMQFNLPDPTAGETPTAWFVVDKSGRVRALGRDGLPPGGFLNAVADALALPVRGANRTTSAR